MNSWLQRHLLDCDKCLRQMTVILDINNNDEHNDAKVFQKTDLNTHSRREKIEKEKERERERGGGGSRFQLSHHVGCKR